MDTKGDHAKITRSLHLIFCKLLQFWRCSLVGDQNILASEIDL